MNECCKKWHQLSREWQDTSKKWHDQSDRWQILYHEARKDLDGRSNVNGAFFIVVLIGCAGLLIPLLKGFFS